MSPSKSIRYDKTVKDKIFYTNVKNFGNDNGMTQEYPNNSKNDKIRKEHNPSFNRRKRRKYRLEFYIIYKRYKEKWGLVALYVIDIDII